MMQGRTLALIPCAVALAAGAVLVVIGMAGLLSGD